MKSSTILFMAMLAVWSIPQEVYAARVLVETRYTPDPLVSRMWFNFTGSGQVFLTRLNDRQFRLTFPDTRAGTSSGLTPLVLPHGPAKSVSFDRPDTNTLRALVTLRQAADYSLQSEGSRIIVEMHPTDTNAVVGLPVDISSMVMAQVNNASAEAPSVGQVRQGPSFMLIPFLVAIGSALAGTTVLMFYLKRRFSAAPPCALLPSVRREPTDPVKAILHEARIILEEKGAAKKNPLPAFEPDDGNVVTAKSFGRGRGEVALAMKIERQRGTITWETPRMHSEVLKGTPRAAARRFGVGTGEIALARSLQKIDHEQRTKGEMK